MFRWVIAVFILCATCVSVIGYDEILVDPGAYAVPSDPWHIEHRLQVSSLRNKWDDAVSWDIGPKTQRVYPNPSSNPWSELLIGDSRIYYKMPNVRTYFRFRINLPYGAEITSAKLFLRCSFGGKMKPMLNIRYIDLAEFPSFEKEPWKMPLSKHMVRWVKEENDWNWKTHGHYKTPNLRNLIQEYINKYGGEEREIGLVIENSNGNKDAFKGICSFDDEPFRSAKLVIRYKKNWRVF